MSQHFRKKMYAGKALLCLATLTIAATQIAPRPAFAQVTTASLSGTVLDPTGATIASAQIELTNTATGDVRKSVSNGSGAFSFSAVPTGDYNVTITAKGFQTYTQTGIHLDPQDQRALRNLNLAIGSETQTITISAAEAGINTDSGEISTLISQQQIQKLSVQGRDVTELFKILPGFAPNAQGVNNAVYDPGQVSVNGALGQYAGNGTPLNGVSLLSDGADITDPGNFGAAIQTVNYDQVAEVKIQTSSFTADTARGPVVVNAVGASGGNKYHGSLYTYARASQLNSTDWLANYTGQTKPPDRQVYPGFTFGGPVLIPGTKFNEGRKLAFWAGAEQYAQRNAYAYGGASGALLSALVPTAGMRNGDFSEAQIRQYLGDNTSPAGTAAGPCSTTNTTYNNICQVPVTATDGSPIVNGQLGAFLDPGAKAILNSLPLPNRPTGTNSYNYITTNLIDNNLWQARGRADYAPSEKHKIFAVYSTERGKAGIPQSFYYSPRGNSGGINTPGGGLLSTLNAQLGSLNIASVFTPTLTNELFLSGSYLLQNFSLKNAAALDKSAVNYPYNGLYANGSNALPQLQDYNFDGLPIALYPDTTLTGGVFAKKWVRGGGDNLTKQLGTHTVRGGIFVQLDNNNQVDPNGTPNGSFSLYYFPETFTPPVAGAQLIHNTGAVGSGSGGNYLANFAEGSVQSYSQQNKPSIADLYFWNVSGYVQDHWRILPNFSVDLGIRLEHLTPWGDAGKIGVPIFRPSAYSNAADPSTLPGFFWHAKDNSVPVTGRATRWAYVEPRVGFAWDVYGQGATVLRAGGGVYRAHDSYNDAQAGIGTSQGRQSLTQNATTLKAVSASTQPITVGKFDPTSSKLNGFTENDDETPQVITWNVSVDQKMPGHSFFEIAYVGNKSSHILNNGANQNTNLDDINALPIGALYGKNPVSGAQFSTAQYVGVGGLQDAIINQYRPYRSYKNLLIAQHNIYANYHSLQTSWNKQSGHLTYGLNYTFSKSLGILGAQSNGLPVNPFNLRDNYNPTSYDHTHIFNASYNYSVGKVVNNRFLGGAINGWEISGITNYISGGHLPAIYNPSLSFGGSIGPQNGAPGGLGQLNLYNIPFLGTPDVLLVPRLTCDPSANSGAHQYINVKCFAPPTQLLSNGTYRFPYLRGPAFFQSDLTLIKNFGFRETQNIQFRVAAFNFLNRANTSFNNSFPNQTNLTLRNPDPTIGNPTLPSAIAGATSANTEFGIASQKQGRRIMELSLKYSF